MHNRMSSFQVVLLDQAFISVVRASLYLRTLWCYVNVFKKKLYLLHFTLLSLLGLALYLVD